MTQKIKIIFYKQQDGSVPVKEFLDGLNEKMRAKMLRTISILQTQGNAIRAPESKPIGDGLFELRAQVGTNISRVMYFFFIGDTAILTNGFVKKTQKTPIKEIEKALKYRQDYLQRYGDTNG